MADYGNTNLNITKAQVIALIDERSNELVRQNLSAATGLPLEAIQYSAANNRWELWNGSAWVALSSEFNMRVTSAADADTCGLADDSTLLGGLPLSGITTPTANSVPRRNASGYLYSNYFNMSANNIGAGQPTRVAVEQNTDGFLRWQTWANFVNRLVVSLTPSFAAAGHTHAAPSWVEVFSGPATQFVTNSWGSGLYMVTQDDGNSTYSSGIISVVTGAFTRTYIDVHDSNGYLSIECNGSQFSASRKLIGIPTVQSRNITSIRRWQ